MSVLTEFQQNAERNDLYRSRLQAMMLQATLAQDAHEKAEAQARQEALEAQAAVLEAALEAERAEKERALSAEAQQRAEKERERAEKDRAHADLAKALERLRAAGLPTD